VTLDVRTLVVVLLVSALLMSAILTLDLRRGRAPGLGRWNAGLALFGAGWLLMALRGVVPAIAGVALANALLLGGLCQQCAALRELGGRPVGARWLLVPPVVLFLLLLPLLDRYAALTLLVSAVYATAFVFLAIQTVRLGAHAGPVRWLSAAILCAAAPALLARAFDIWRLETPGMFTGSALHALTFIMLLAVTISSSFAFLVMQRRRGEEDIRYLAMYDGLTGLYNRRAFLELAGRELSRAQRAGMPTAALMIDLDHFKQVNDQRGHAFGDRVLATFAGRLRDAVRTADIPGRYGGEEFCVLLPGAEREEAAAVAERVRRAAGSPSVSIGVAVSARSGRGIDELLADADAALYRAKKAGRNRIAVSKAGLESAPLAA
jgi:diguanylate cyclase (GGDEF)-like protein